VEGSCGGGSACGVWHESVRVCVETGSHDVILTM
jgi:hypothetical protein